MKAQRNHHDKKNCGVNSPGRNAKIDPISDYEARQRALQIMSEGGAEPGAQRVIELLAQGGVMTEAQLKELADISYDRLLVYRHKHYLTQVPTPPKLKALLPATKRRVYILGKVGLNLAGRGGRQVPMGYQLDVPVDRITHDVLAVAVYHRLWQALTPLGYEVCLRGKYAATVYDAEGRPDVEPDALIEIQTPQGDTRHFLLEYHNESWGTRAPDKVEKYETLLGRRDESPWRQAWHIPPPAAGEEAVMPRVLVVWTHRAVGSAYATTVRERSVAQNGLWTLYLGKSISALLDEAQDPLQWHNFNFNQPFHLLRHR